MSLATVLMWFASTFGARLLLSLGMGFISFGAVTVAANVLIAQFSSAWSGIPSAMLSILSLAGFPTALGWIIGAWLARISLNALSKIGRLPT